MPCVQVYQPSLKEIDWTELLLDRRTGFGFQHSCIQARVRMAYGRKTMGPVDDGVTDLTSPDPPHTQFGWEGKSWPTVMSLDRVSSPCPFMSLLLTSACFASGC